MTFRLYTIFFIMKVNGFHYIFLCFMTATIRESVSGKSVFDNNLGETNIQRAYPVKRVAPNPIPYSGDITQDFIDPLLSQPRSISAQHHRKLSGSQIYRSSDTNHKRSSVDSALNLKADTVKKRNLFSDHVKEDEPFGVVFSHGKAIGVLKPLSQSFELSSFEEEKEPMLKSNLLLTQDAKAMYSPVKREINVDESESAFEIEQHSKYSDGRYPEILANFKIGNKLQLLRQGQDNKRENPYMKKIENSKLTVNSKEKRSTDVKETENTLRKDTDALTDISKDTESLHDSSDNIDEIEENLRGVISDLGLASSQEETKEKRSALEDEPAESKRAVKEDENLENGENKISLKKEEHPTISRTKKEDVSSLSPINSGSISTESSVKNSKREITTESAIQNQQEIKDKNIASEASATIIRSKRQEKASQSENSDIVKGLETSGELTVSGNKSPLASSSNEHEVNSRETPILKQSSEDFKTNEGKEKRDDKINFDKEIEQNLQLKINAIKEEVKREFNDLKKNKADLDPLRGKRAAEKDTPNTLLEEEKGSLTPELNNVQSLIPHIRSKRMLEDQEKKDKIIVENSKLMRRANKYIQKRDVKQNVPVEAEANLAANKANCPGGHTIQGNTVNQNVQSADQTNLNNENRGQRNSQDDLLEVKQSVDIASRANEDSAQNIQDYTKTVSDSPISSENLDKISDDKNKECPSKIKRDEALKVSEKRQATAEQPVAKKADPSANSQIVQALQENLSNSASSKRKRRTANYKLHHSNIQKNIDHLNAPIVYARRKRANAVIPDGNIAYIPYRSEDDEVDDEGDEFDDDGFDDRSSSLVRRRREQDYYPVYRKSSEDYDDLTNDEYETENLQNEYYPKGVKLVKRESMAREYVNNMNSDVDQNSNYENYLYNNPNRYLRRKRQNLENDVVAVHGGSATEQHMSSARERIQYPLRHNFRRKRLGKENSGKSNMKRYESMEELTDSDVFGALPQSYEGELSRFKRVKRSNDKENPT